MIRNRFPLLIQQKRRRQPQRTNQQPSLPYQPLPWQYDYSHFKSELSEVDTTNRDIQKLIDQYSINPTVYNMRALQRMLENNCKRINQIEAWASRFPYSNHPPTEVQLERNLVRHFQSCLITHVNALFAFRNRLSILTEEFNGRDRSYNSLNQSNSISWDTVNRSVQERGASIREVSAQIEALNSILRRMGDIVASQGELVNRIDEHLSEGVSHVSRGAALLRERAQRQNGCGGGDDEWSCQGKINKVIFALYITNIILIAILVIKNL